MDTHIQNIKDRSDVIKYLDAELHDVRYKIVSSDEQSLVMEADLPDVSRIKEVKKFGFLTRFSCSIRTVQIALEHLGEYDRESDAAIHWGDMDDFLDWDLNEESNILVIRGIAHIHTLQINDNSTLTITTIDTEERGAAIRSKGWAREVQQIFGESVVI